MTLQARDPYIVAAKKLLGEGFTFDAKTCFYERGPERLKLTWNGRVYARRPAPPKPPVLVSDLSSELAEAPQAPDGVRLAPDYDLGDDLDQPA